MMRIQAVLFLCLTMVACSKVETAESQTAPADSPVPKATPTEHVVSDVRLKPVKLGLKLTKKEEAYLNESLPPNVREILENADRFEILAEVNKDETTEYDSREFIPNRIAVVPNEELKRDILAAFYSDASSEDAPAVCYEPHHAIRATYRDKSVVVEICFSCSRFTVRGTEFWGTIVREGRRSEDLLTRVVAELGTDLSR